MARSRYKFVENDKPYFLTCTIVNWLPLFTDIENVKIILDIFSFLQNEKRLSIYGYVVLENHLHLVADTVDLSKQISNFKSYSARKIIDHLKSSQNHWLLSQLKLQKNHHKKDRDYQVWQEGSHPQLIQDEVMMRQKLEYIHNNPVARGYMDDPSHWRYSSARNYADMEGLIKVTTEW